MSDDPSRDVVIFTEALRLPIEARAAFLDHACAGDENLQREVEALLEAHERVGDFLEKRPFKTGPQVRAHEKSDSGQENPDGNNGETTKH